jgi:macrolide transport system ATP-binding/permease protein
MNIIEIKKLNKTYRTGKVEFKALDDVSVTVERGEFVAIMGPSGSGKSTLMHLMGFLDSPDSGSYIINGRETSGLSDDEYAQLRSSVIGFVFQQFHLLARESTIENIELPLIYAGTPDSNGRGLKLLKDVGLSSKENNMPNELSGGERQRVAVSRALINDPDIILADEPTGNLDSKSQTEIMELLSNLNKNGKTVIVVTHDEEVSEYAARIIKIRDGKVVSDEKKIGKNYIAPKDLDVKKENEKSTAKPVITRIEFVDYIKQAYNSILGNKMRSILSMLGILIGVAAVIAMLGVGQGAKDSIAKSLSSLGSNLLTVIPGNFHMGGVSLGTATVTRFTEQDIEALEKLPDVKYVSGTVSGRAQVVFGGKNWNTSVQGVGVNYPVMRNSVPSYGAFFTDEDMRSRNRVCLLGQTVINNLFGDANPVGREIKINRIAFKVIGVLPLKGATGFRDQDDIIILPLSTAMYRLLGKIYIDSIDVQVKDMNLMDAAEDEITQVIRKKHRITNPDDTSFQIMNMAELQKTFAQTSEAMSLLLGFIAAISLLVGGIGIMNIMLVSVTERTREIGLRKAIGAKRKDILTQFLIEAVLMTFLGGVAGIILGGLIALLISVFAKWNVEVSAVAIIGVTLFSIAVGVVFGIMPARKAAELSPIDALRYE